MIAVHLHVPRGPTVTLSSGQMPLIVAISHVEARTALQGRRAQRGSMFSAEKTVIRRATKAIIAS